MTFLLKYPGVIVELPRQFTSATNLAAATDLSAETEHQQSSVSKKDKGNNGRNRDKSGKVSEPAPVEEVKLSNEAVAASAMKLAKQKAKIYTIQHTLNREYLENLVAKGLVGESSVSNATAAKVAEEAFSSLQGKDKGKFQKKNQKQPAKAAESPVSEVTEPAKAALVASQTNTLSANEVAAIVEGVTSSLRMSEMSFAVHFYSTESSASSDSSSDDETSRSEAESKAHQSTKKRSFHRSRWNEFEDIPLGMRLLNAYAQGYKDR
jgi:hypothetical protein